MSLYETIITCVALLNLALTITTLRAASHKAASTRLEALERDVREKLAEHESSLTRLLAIEDGAVTHDHLAEVYKAINGVAAQVHTLLGQQQQMNENLRLLLNRLGRES